jgi:hypothetical protein
MGEKDDMKWRKSAIPFHPPLGELCPAFTQIDRRRPTPENESGWGVRATANHTVEQTVFPIKGPHTGFGVFPMPSDDERRDEILKRMLKTPPSPMIRPVKKGKASGGGKRGEAADKSGGSRRSAPKDRKRAGSARKGSG